MYVDIDVSNASIPFLIDTGSSVTMISVQTWKQLGLDLVPLAEVGSNYAGVDGRPLHIKGKCTLFFKFQAFEAPVTVVVASISLPGILGFDFLSEYNCSLRMGENAMLYVGRMRQAVPLRENLSDCSFKVALVETIVIPAGREVVVMGGIELGYGETIVSLEKLGLLESDPSIAEGRQILVARALVDPSEGKVPVRLFNTSSLPTTLYKGSHVGVISSVNNVIETGLSTVEDVSEPLPPDLEQLYERGSQDLCSTEQETLREFLKSNRDVFSCKDEALGRTGLVKHKIDTGNATPIRQYPKRLHFPWN